MVSKINYNGREYYASKAALHVHSTVSDGGFTPAEVISLYKNLGFDILAFSDHSATNPVSTYDGQGMVLLSGMEMHPMGPRNERWHFLCLGIPEDFPNPAAGDVASPQQCIDAVNAEGGLVFCAHPAYCGFRSGDIAPLKGLAGMEVFNSDTRFAGKGYNMHCFDELADDGILMNMLAVDDMHSLRDLNNGWTMILTEEPPTAETVLAALRTGMFYATQGPEIHSLTVNGNHFEADFSPCMEAIGVSFRWRGYTGMCENLNGPEDGVQEITHCEFALKNDIPHARWLRLQLKDKCGHYAWSNYIRF